MGLIGIMSLIGLMGFLGCSSDDSPEQRGELTKLELIPYYNIYREMELDEGTRGERNTDLFGPTDGEGLYMPYEWLYPQADPSYSKIRVYLKGQTDRKDDTYGNFTFHAATYYTAEEADDYNTEHNLTEGNADYKTEGDEKTAARWSSSVWMNNGVAYWVYGFMPASAASNATLTTKDGSYANKAVLTLNGLDAVTPADVCIIVGVKGANKGTHDVIANSGIEIGKFEYLTQPEYVENDNTTGNYIYLLLDHLYACINMEYLVGTEYSRLRTIKLRKVEIQVTGAGAKKQNLEVTIDRDKYLTDLAKAVADGTNPQDVQPFTVRSVGADESDSNSAIIFDKSRANEGAEIPVKGNAGNNVLSVPGYFTPSIGNTFTIVSTYDVFDKKGNEIRSMQTATNTVKLAGDTHTHWRGKVHTLRLLVEPTYIYQLSEDDLNNPTIKIKVD